MPLVNMTLEEFFQAALAEAVERERLRITDAARRYVTLLLVRQDYHPGTVLSEEFAHAVDAATDQVGRISVMHQLQDIGDRALIAAGLWWEYEFRPRRLSNHVAHVLIGRRAYRTLGDHPFTELAEKFEGLVDALMRLSTCHLSKSDPDILRLYTLWTQTGNGYAAKALAEHGISPVPAVSTTPS